MARRSSEEKRAFWQTAVQLHRQSGLSVREFCQREGLSQASFFAWRRKLRQQATQTQSEQSSDGQPEQSPRLVPVRLLGGGDAAPVEVVSPNGLVLRVRDDAATENVRRVLGLMQELA